MWIVSARANFTDADKISTNLRCVLWQGTTYAYHSMNELSLLCANKKVLLVTHGFNCEYKEVLDSFAVIEDNIKKHCKYDIIIGFIWAGGDATIDWFKAESNADDTGILLADFINSINLADRLDIMAHSLGNRVVFNALKQCYPAVIHNCYSLAAAVDNESLEYGEEFDFGLLSCQKLHIFHSIHDGVLSLCYVSAAKDLPLGLSGPENPDIFSKNEKVKIINCKDKIKSHSEYKKHPYIFEYINNC